MIRTRNVRRLWNRFSRFFFGAGPWQSPAGKQILKPRSQREVALEALEDRVTPASMLYDAAADRLIFLMNSGESITSAASSNTDVKFSSSVGFSNLTVPAGIVSISGSTATFTLTDGADPVTSISVLGSSGNESFLFNTVGSVNDYAASGASLTVDPAVETFTGINAVTAIGGLTVSSGTIYLQNNITTSGNLTFGTRAIINPTSTLTLSYASATFSNGVSGQNTKSLVLNSSGSTNVDANFLNLVDLSVTGGTTNLSGTVTTLGAQSYTSPVVLNDNTTLVGTTVTLTGNVNSQATETNNLTVTGNAVLGGTFGGSQGVGAISVSGTTTLNAGADIASLGAQTYTGAVTLAGNATLRGTGAATLTTTGGITGAGKNLTLNFPTVSVGTGIAGVANLDVTGSTAINLGDVTTTGTQTYNNTVTLAANTTLQGTTINLGGITGSGGAKNLTITGNPVFGTAISTGNVAALAVTGNATINAALSVASVSVSGTTAAGADVTTSGTQTYTGAVTLQTANRTFTGSTVTFTGGVVGGSKDLTVTGNAGFGGTTSGVGALSVSGTTSLGGSITTTGNQTYTGAVTLSGNSSLIGSGTAALSTPGGITGAGKNLTLDFATVTVGLSIAGVQNLDVTGSTAIILNSVITTGTQTYNSPVTLGGNTTLTADDGATDQLITFVSTVSGATYDFTVNDNVKFQGDATGLANLMVIGTTNIGANISSTGNQTYTGAVTLAASPTLTSTGGNVVFSGTVNGDGVSDRALTVSAATGTATFNGAVGGTTRIGALSVTGSTISLNADIKTANAVAAFTGPVTLDTVATVTISTSSAGTAGGNVTFSSTVKSSNHKALTVNAGSDASTGGVVTFTGNIGGTPDTVGALNVTGKTINLPASIETRDAAVTFTGATLLTANTVIDTTDGVSTTGANVTFAGTLDSTGSARNLTTDNGTAGNLNFQGTTGGTLRLGVLQVNNVNTINVDGNFTANSITATNSTVAFDSSGFTITTTGLSDTNGGAIAITTTGALTTGNLITTGGTATAAGKDGGAVALNAGTALSVGAINTSGSNAVSGSGGAPGALTLVSATGTTLNGDITAKGGDTLNGNGGNGANLTFSQAITLGANVTINTRGGTTTGGGSGGANGNVNFASTIDGGYNLTVDTNQGAGVTLGGAVGAGTRLGALDLSAMFIYLNNADIKTANANATFRGAVTLGANVTVDTDTAAGDVLFTSTINGSGNGLTIKAGTGAVTLSGQTGTSVSNRLSSLTITSGGAVNLDGGVYAGSVSVGQTGTVASFDSAGFFIDTSGDTNINGGAVLVTTTGGITTGILNTSAGPASGGAGTAGKNGGQINLNGSTISVGSINTSGSGAAATAAGGNAGSITFTSVSGITLNSNITATGGSGSGGGSGQDGGNGASLSFSQGVTLGGDVTILTAGGVGEGSAANGTAGAVLFNSTIDGAKNLTINTTGGTSNTVTFGGDVGGSTPIGALTVTGSIIYLNANIATNNAAALFQSPTKLGTVATVNINTVANSGNGGDVRFASRINSPSNSSGLTITTGSATTEFKGTLGEFDRILALAVTAGNIDVYANISTKNSSAVFNGVFNLYGTVTIDTSDSGSGAVTFNGAINPNAVGRDLILDAGATGAIAFNGAVGGGTYRLDDFTITSSGAVDVNANFTANSFTATASTASFDSAGYTISTAPGATDTNGGAVAITTTTTLTTGAIDTSGGTSPTTNGRSGGAVALNAGTALNVGAITTSGTSAVNGTGGNAGAITFGATTGVTLNGNITAKGGDGAGTNQNGGNGSNVLFGSAASASAVNVTLGDTVSIQTAGGAKTGTGTTGAAGNVGFYGLVSGAQDLTVNAGSGSVTFGRPYTTAGSGTDGFSGLTGLDVTGGSIRLDGGSGTSNGAMTFNGPVSIAGAYVTYTLTSGGSAITFNDTVSSNQSTGLEVNSGAGVTTFGSTVGGGGAGDLGSLKVTASTAKLYGNVTTQTSGKVHIIGTTQLYSNIAITVQFNGDPAFNFIKFDGPIDRDTSARNLTINAATLPVYFNGKVGSTGTGIGALSVTSTNDINLNADVQTSTGTVGFSGNVLLGANVSINTVNGANGANINFNNNLNSTGSARNLTLESGTGNITFTGSVGNTGALGTVTVNAANNVTISSAFNAGTFNQAVAGSGTFLLNGALTTTTGAVTINSDTDTINATINSGSNNINVTQTTGTLTLDTTFTSTGTINFTAPDFNIVSPFTITPTPAAVNFNGTSGTNLYLGTAGAGASIDNAELARLSGAVAFSGDNVYVDGVDNTGTANLTAVTITSAADTVFQTAASSFNSSGTTDVTVTATGDVILGTNVTAGGTVILNATTASKAIQVTTNATITSTAEAITLDGDVTGTANSLVLTATNATNGAISIGKSGASASTVSVIQLNATAGTTLDLSDATVTTVRSGQAGGSVTLTSGGNLTTGSITTTGGTATSTNGYAGGAVSLTSTTNGNIVVGAINTSGSAGNGTDKNGGNGGSISLTLPAGKSITLNGDLNTSGGAATGTGTAGAGAAVTLGRAVVLGGNTTITTTGSTNGAVAFQDTLNGRYALNVVAGTAAVSFTSVIGTGVDNANTLSSLTVTSAGAVTFSASAYIDGETQVTGSTSITLAGAVYDSTNDGFAFTGPVSVTNASAAITTGGGTGDDISFSSTLNGSSANNLSLTAGSGDIGFGGAVGGTSRFGALQVVSAGAITSQAITANSFTVTSATSFNSGTYGITTLLAGQAGGAVSITTTGLITTGTVNTAGGTQSTTGGNGYNAGAVTLNSSGGVVTVGAVLASGSNSNQGTDGGTGGTVAITGSSILLNGGINAAGGTGDVNGAANGGNITLSGPATLNGTPTSYTLTTGAGAGNISVGSIAGGTKNLKLVSGSGSITASGDLTNLGTLTLQDGALFLASAGDATFQGAVNASALVTYDTAYNLSLLGGGTISGNTTLRNTGTLALGDASGSDVLTFTNGLNATAASAITTGGTISTTNKNLTLGDFSTTGSTTFGAGTGVITLGAATVGTGTMLTLGQGGSGAISITSIEDGAGTGGLTVNSTGVVAVSGAVDIAGALTVSSTGGSASFARNVSAGSLSVGAGAYDLLFLENLTVTAATTLGAVSGTVRFGDASDDVTTFTGGLNSTAVTGTLRVAGSLSTTNTALTLGAVTLDSAVTLATGTGSSADLTTGAVTSNGNALTVNAGDTLTLGAIANLTGGLTVTSAGGAASIGALGAGSPGNVTITNSSAGVTFNGDVNANTLTVTNTTAGQAITFADGQSVSIATLSLGAQAYDLVVNSNNFTVTNAATLGNTGSVTLGNGAADVTTFAGGVTRSSGTTNVAGTVRAVNNNITLPAFNATASATLGAGSGTISTGRATVTNAASTLTLGQGGSGTINMAGVTGGTGVLADIVFNTLGTVNMTGTITGSVDELAITNVGLANFDAAVTAASFNQAAGSSAFDGALTLGGAFAFKGAQLQLGGAVTGATTVDITASTAFNTENSGTINASGLFVQNGMGANYLAGNITAASITFNQPVNLTDGAVTFTTGGAVGNNILINGPLNGNSAITLAAGSGDVTLRSVGNDSDVISLGITGANLNLMGLVDVGTLSAAVTGAASVRGIITGDTGAVSLSAASVNLRSRSIVAGSGGVGLTATSGTLTVSSASPITSGGTIGLTAAAGLSLGANLTSTDAAIQVSGPLSLTADATLSSGSGAVTFTGAVNGARNLVVASNGLTRFQGTVGATTPLSALVLDAGGAARFDANVTTVGSLTVGDNLTLGGNVVLATTNSPITVNGTVNGLVANGQTLGLTAGAGSIAVNGAIGGTTALGAITVNSAGNVSTGAITATSFTQAAGTGTTSLGGVVSLTGNFAFTGTTLAVTQALTSTGGSVSVNNTGLFITDPTGDITSAGAFTQSGSGVDSANRLAGNITTTNANISLGSGTTLTGALVFSTGAGAGDITLNGAVNGGQDLGLTAGAGNIILRSIGNLTPVGMLSINSATNVTGFSQINAAAFQQLAGTGTTNLRGVSTLGTSGIYVVTGAITLQSRPIYTAAGGSVWLQAQTGALDVRSASSINSSGAVTLSGGAVTLASTINSTNNAVSVTANTLALTGSINSGTAGTTITATGAITGSSGTTANVAASSLAMAGSAIGTGVTPIRVKAGTLTTNTSGSNGNQYLAIDPLVDAVVGAADINAGAGTVYLTGGRLVTSSGCNVIGSVSVGSGATLTGSGTVSGSVTMAAGGNFFPGSSTSPFVGTLSTGAVTMTGGSTFSSYLGAGNACGAVASSGAVNLGGATLNITGVDSAVAVGNVFTLISGTSLTGLFNGLAEAAIFSAGGKNFRINYTATSVTLTVVA